MTTRTCAHCGETKHELAFAIDRHSPDGFSRQCRDCKGEANRKCYALKKTERARRRVALARFTPLPGAS